MKAYHLTYAGAAMRAALLRSLAGLQPGWWWVDISDGVIEVVVPDVPGLPGTAVVAAAALASATPVAHALSLAAHLLPGGQPCRAYLALHAVASGRALVVLGRGPVDDDVVAGELAGLFQGLFGRSGHRRTAIEANAAWLERVAQRRGAPLPRDAGVTLSGSVVSPGGPLRRPMTVDAGAVADYARHRERLARQALATRVEGARTVMVARLAHAQAVRLWGPHDSLARALGEAALVRSLA
jgi:hypothetical protein